jgi:hypothetical protein
MTNTRRSIARAFIVLLLSVAGCTGGVSLPAGFQAGSDGVAGPAVGPGVGEPPVSSTKPASGVPGMSGGALDGARVTLRRLNRAEYDNTVRDLLGTMTKPSDKFPGDTVVDGFDTVGEALSFSNLLTEQVEAAADVLVAELVGRPKGDPLRARVLVCEPAAANYATCIPQILKPFISQAYRRPAEVAEVQDLADLAATVQASSGDPLRGLSAALKTVLLSPHFLFHIELGNPTSKEATPLNPYELASRLSYFLWSSMPDPELSAAAASAALTRDRVVLRSQVGRMLDDPRGQAVVANFGGQWLSIREVAGVSPDATSFPNGRFDQALLQSIPEETSQFFASLIAENQPVGTLLLADYTFANPRLAEHYGLKPPPSAGAGLVRTSLLGVPRLGLLTQETFLTTSSQPDRTSPVRRGNWVLERILCDPPPAPPPGIPPLETPAAGTKLTVRAALAKHRANPSCGACHDSIDPIGLGFENFDAIGAYRTTDNGVAIEASGTLANGAAYKDAIELIRVLAADPRFPRCVVKQAMTYAIGRSFESEASDAYVTSVAAPITAATTFRDLFAAVAESEAFLTRRGEAE